MRVPLYLQLVGSIEYVVTISIVPAVTWTGELTGEKHVIYPV